MNWQYNGKYSKCVYEYSSGVCTFFLCVAFSILSIYGLTASNYIFSMRRFSLSTRYLSLCVYTYTLKFVYCNSMTNKLLTVRHRFTFDCTRTHLFLFMLDLKLFHNGQKKITSIESDDPKQI